MSQGFMTTVAQATQNDYSVILRGIRFVPGDFSDLEVGPLATLGTQLESGDWASGLAGMVSELYLSLKTIYGDVIDQFHNPATGRLTLHSPELLLLSNAAMNKLAADPHYKASQTQAQKASAQLQASAEFAGAVAAKLAPVPVAGPNPEEVALQAEIDKQRQIQELSDQLALLRAESGV